MIKERFYFHKNVTSGGIGQKYRQLNRDADAIMIISCTGDSPNAMMTFFGRATEESAQVEVKACCLNNFTMTNTGITENSYAIPLSGYYEISVTLSNVADTCSVIGEVIY